MTFKSFRSPDRWQALAALAGLLLFDVLLILLAANRAVDGLTFMIGLWVLLSVLVLVYLGYRTLGVFTLQYWVNRDAVTLVWGSTRQVVPMGEIRRIQRGLPGRAHSPARFWHWPCPHRRRYYCEGVGMVNAYAACPLAEQIILVTDGESFGVSPADAEGFIKALQERYALGVARPLRVELRRPPLWTWRLWRDAGALFLIGAGLLGVLLLFGLYAFRLPGLPADLPLHFDVNGLPDRIAPKTDLVALPAIGLLAWGLNLVGGIAVYRRVQRQGAYLLWGGALVVQVIAGLALLNIMRW